MIIKKSLRNNLKKALQMRAKEECDSFVSQLSLKERDDLLIYCDAHFIKEQLALGKPVNEYFLQHYEDYMSKRDFEIRQSSNRKMQILWNGIFVLAILIAASWRLIGN